MLIMEVPVMTLLWFAVPLLLLAAAML